MFKLRDVPFIAILLLFIVLSFLGALSNNPLPARLICVGLILFNLFLLVGFYVMRWKFLSKITYVSPQYKIKVICSEKNCPTKDTIDSIVNEIIGVLSTYGTTIGYKDWTTENMTEIIKGTYCEFVDIEAIPLTYRSNGNRIKGYVYGYSTGEYVKIGNKDTTNEDERLAHVKSVIRHELTHSMLVGLDLFRFGTNEGSHPLMKRLGLN